MDVVSELKKDYTLHTVDLALAEGLNVIWRHANVLKDLKPDEAKSAAEDLTRIFDGLKVVAAWELGEETMQIALS